MSLKIKFVTILFIIVCNNFNKGFSQNKAINFNGTSNYFEVANSGQGSAFDFTTDSFTVEAWIYPYFNVTTTNIECTILGNDSVTNNGSGYVFRTGGNRKLSFAYNYGGGWNEVLTSSPVLNYGYWQHVAVSKSNGAIDIYVDGLLVATSIFQSNTNIVSSAKSLKIGENGNLSNRKFKGYMDEVKIWKVARTQLEIQDDMNEICQSYPSSLLAYFKMNDTGTVGPINIVCQNNPNYNSIFNSTFISLNGPSLYNRALTTLYVDSSNSNIGCGYQTGTSWASAFTELHAALKEAYKNPKIEKILVAKGTYKPSDFPFEMNQFRIGYPQFSLYNVDKTFDVRVGLELSGGYANGGSILPDYSVNKTILDGILGPGPVDTCNTVVFIDSSDYWGIANDTTKIVGFTIQNGRANLNGTIDIGQGFGGGIFCKKGLVVIENNVITNNKSINLGSGISSKSSFCLINNNIIYNNKPIDPFTNYGSAVYIDGGYCRVLKNKIYKNVVGVHHSDGIARIRNNEIFEHTEHGIFLSTSALVDSNNIHHNQGLNGAGIEISYAYGPYAIIVKDNLISDNKVVYYGGGLNVLGTTYVQIQNNHFRNDTASHGGALNVDQSHHVYVGKNTMIKNHATALASAIILSGNHSLFKENIIDSNYTATGHHATYFDGFYDTVINNIIVNNKSDNVNAGIGVASNYFVIANNLIANNISRTSAAIYCWGTFGNILNNTIFNNISTDTTIGYVTAGIEVGSGNQLIANNIFWKNKIGSSYSSLGTDYLHNGGTVTFKNNSFQLPSTSYTSTGSGVYDIGLSPTNNVFSIDPQFLDTNMMSGNDHVFGTSDDGLHLNYTSPLINAGLNSVIPPISVKDLANNNRFDGSAVDIGAYELTCIPFNNTPVQFSSVCLGQNTTLTSQVNYSASNVQWFDDSLSNNVIHIGQTYTTPNLYAKDTFWVSNDSCSAGVRIPIVVEIDTLLPVISNTTPLNLLTICANNPAFLEVSSNVISDSVFWYADSVSNVPIQSGFTYTTPNLFSQDTFWVSAHAKCSMTNKIPIIVTVHPQTGSSTNTTSCNNFYWQQTSTNYTQSGVYQDTILNSNGCDSIITLNLTINTTNASINQTGNILTASPSGSNYQWLTCNPYQIINGETSQTFVVNSNGQYAVITTLNGCADTSSCYTVSNLNIDYRRANCQIKVSPMPVLHVMNISSTEIIYNSKITISNAHGQIVFSTTVEKMKNMEIDMSAFSNGIYYLKISDSIYQNILKIIKE